MRPSLSAFLLSGVFAVTLAVSASAQAETGHLNRPVRDHVVLNLRTGAGDPAGLCTELQNHEWREVLPNGDFADEAYEVPEGRRLVITDVDWSGFVDTPVGDSYVQIGLGIVKGIGGNPQFFFARPVPVVTNRVRGNDQLTSGFAIDDVSILCPFSSAVVPPSTFSGFIFETMILRGYLIDVETGPPDADQDGVPDDADGCPDTPPETMVDAEGCSQAQFCASKPTSPYGYYYGDACTEADWKGDEPNTYHPKDCRSTGKACVPY